MAWSMLFRLKFEDFPNKKSISLTLDDNRYI